MQAWLGTISLALCKVCQILPMLVKLNLQIPLLGSDSYTNVLLLLMQAFDLLEMLKKEEEMLLAVKERQSKVLVQVVFDKLKISYLICKDLILIR